jgi:signal transduction histidine kinase
MEINPSLHDVQSACILRVEPIPAGSWTDVIEEAGYPMRSLSAETGLCDKINQINPDLIFMALEPDGSAICRLLKQDERVQAFPVVLVGQKFDSDEQVSGLLQGALDVIPASMEPHLLLAKVRGWVRLTRMARESQCRLVKRLQAQKLADAGQLAADLAHEINSALQAVRDNLGFVQDAVQNLMDLQAPQGRLREAAQPHGVEPELLAAVDQAVQHADLDYLAEELPAALSQSFDGIEQVTTVIRSLQNLTPPPTVRPGYSNLNEALETVLRTIRTRWESAVCFETDLDPALPLVPCFLSELNHGMLNLIENACEAIVAAKRNEKGIVHLATRGGAKEVQILIRDSGCGIPPEILPRIFDPFFTTKTSEKGVGQGLAVAWNVIVNQHHGAIRVTPADPHGSCFTLSLPLG